MKIRRTMTREEGGDYVRFVMDVPLQEVNATPEISELCKRVLNPTATNAECLTAMSKMIRLIEERTALV